jgi:hypothetical protein
LTVIEQPPSKEAISVFPKKRLSQIALTCIKGVSVLCVIGK